MHRTLPRAARALTSAALASLLCAGAGAGAASAAAPAADYYLKLGAVQGEAAAKGPEREIEVLSWSWGASQRGTAPAGGSSGSSGGPQIDSWSWGATNSGSAGLGGGKGTGRLAGGAGGGGTAPGAPGSVVAAGDVDADGLARIGKASPLLAKAPASGRLTLRAHLPACAVGTRYADAVVGNAEARVELKDVVVARCAAGEVSLDYASVRALP